MAEARSAASAHDRSIYYESAAQRLPWVGNLYQLAGSAALQADEYERAIILFQNARRKSLLTPDGQFELGNAYFLSGDQDKAIAEWQGLLNGGPSSPGQTQAAVSASPYLADAYHAQARFEDEERVLRQWVAIDPQNAEAQYHLGLLLFADASPEAIPLFEFVASASPELKPSVDGLRVALKTALTSTTLSAGTSTTLGASSTAGRLTSCGQTLAAINEWPLALRAFSRATQADANDALAWAWLGEALQHTGTMSASSPFGDLPYGHNVAGPDALGALQRAAGLTPDSAQVHALFALYWQRQHDWQKARGEFEAAARLEPQNTFWQTSLGDAYVHLGDLVTALTYYQNAVSLAPRDAQTWRALALFSVENGVDEDGVGRDAALRAYALEPDNAQGMDILGRALMATEQYDAAETFFQKALAAAPQDAAAAYHLALLYLQTNKPDLAKQYLLSAQSLDPKGPIGEQASTVLARYFP